MFGSNGGLRRFAFLAFVLWEAAVFVMAVRMGILALTNAGLAGPDSFSSSTHLAIFAALLVVWSGTLNSFGLYTSRRLVRRANEFLMLVVVVTGMAGVLALLGAFLEKPLNEGPFLSWFLITGVVLIVSGRLLVRGSLRLVRAGGRNLRFVAIVGSDAPALNLAREAILKPGTGYQVLGFFDDEDALRRLPLDLPKGGDLAALKTRLMREPVDEVLIALPMRTRLEEVVDILGYCQRVGIPVRVAAEDLQVGQSEMAIEYVAGRPTLGYGNAAHWGWQGRAKHAIDLVASGLGLLALLPLFVVVGALIKLDSPGPVFFTQNRVGKNRRTFRLFKFRTMRADAEAMQADLESQNEAAGPVFKIRNDPRITKLGHFLRRYSIDELPQLINVFRGEMSLVGPRPLPLRDVERFESDWHSRRFSVRPGLTCSWVLAGRSELQFDTWVKMDLDYIDDWSLAKDFRICLGTIPLVFRGSGAY